MKIGVIFRDYLYNQYIGRDIKVWPMYITKGVFPIK